MGDQPSRPEAVWETIWTLSLVLSLAPRKHGLPRHGRCCKADRHLVGEIRRRETPMASLLCVTGRGMGVSPQLDTINLENTLMWVSASFMK